MCVDVRGCSREDPTPVREFSRSMSENRAAKIPNSAVTVNPLSQVDGVSSIPRMLLRNAER